MSKGGNWGEWTADIKTDLVMGENVVLEVSRKGPEPEADHLEVTFYKGEADGKPVIQIDGAGDFRINVNDGVVFNRSTESNSILFDMALAMYHQELGMLYRTNYDYYELVKIRQELIDAGYMPEVIDSHGTLPDPDPYMWVIRAKQGPDVRKLTALCNERHMHSDNVLEAWESARSFGTIGMDWTTLTEEQCKALDVECTKCKQERLVNL